MAATEGGRVMAEQLFGYIGHQPGTEYRPEGPTLDFWPDGTTRRVGQYDNDCKKTGLWQVYDHEGRLVFEAEYEDGHPVSLKEFS